MAHACLQTGEVKKRRVVMPNACSPSQLGVIRMEQPFPSLQRMVHCPVLQTVCGVGKPCVLFIPSLVAR